MVWATPREYTSSMLVLCSYVAEAITERIYKYWNKQRNSKKQNKKQLSTCETQNKFNLYNYS